MNLALALLPAVLLAAAEPPVTPDADEARQWLLDELSDPSYEAAKPTWFDQLSSAILDWLNSLLDNTVAGPSGLLLAIVVIIVVAALIAAFVIFGMPALNRRSAVAGQLFGQDDTRSAASMRRAAEAAASRSEWSLAIEESFRAVARGLAERTILETSPGTTAHGFSAKAGLLFPPLSADLAAAADAFDRVRYLGRQGAKAEYEAVAALERTLREARPPREQTVLASAGSETAG